MPHARVCGTANMGNVGGRAGMDRAVLFPHLCPSPQCQGRTSPDPSGVRPVPSHSCCCQERGHRLVKEEVVLEGGRVHGLNQAAWLEPGHPHWFPYSLSHWSHLPCRRFTMAFPGRAPVGSSPCLPGLGGGRLLVHSPPCARAWWGTRGVPQACLPLGMGAGKWGQESEVATSCWS